MRRCASRYFRYVLIGAFVVSDCYFTGLCVLQRQLAAVSIHISEPCMTPNGSGSGAVAPNSLHMTQGLSSSSSRHSSGSSDILAVTPTEEEPQGPVPLAIMNTPRCSVGAVNLNGNLVVCGRECGVVSGGYPLLTYWLLQVATTVENVCSRWKCTIAIRTPGRFSREW